jgi:4-nitrophenyl phosphatase/NagD protein
MNYEKLKTTRGFILDLDGTVYLGDNLLPGARDFILLLSEREIPFYFLTNNSSRSRVEYSEKLNRLGLEISEDKIFTSGEATAIYLHQQKKGVRIHVVGTPPLEREFRNYGFELVSEDPDFVVLGFDTTLTYQKLVMLCDFVRDGVTYIATHPDINCPTESGFMPDTGSMIALVAASTGRNPDVIVGKPNHPIVDALVSKTGIPAGELAMVGDRLYTDIALGAAGMTTVLVFTGETKAEDLNESPFQPDLALTNLAKLTSIVKNLTL